MTDPEIKAAIKKAVDESRAESKAAIKKAVDELIADLQTLFENSSEARTEIINLANSLGDPDVDKDKVKKCRHLVEKYNLTIPK